MSYGAKTKPPAASRQEAYSSHSQEVNTGITKAAWRLEDVRSGCRPERYGSIDVEEEEESVFQYPDDPKARDDFFRVLKWQKYYFWAIRLMVLLNFLEIPSWCDTKEWFEWKDPTARCGETEDYDHYFLSGIRYLPRGYTFPMEAFGLIICALSLAFEYNLQEKYFKKFQFEPIGQEPYFQVWRIKACAFFLILNALDMLLCMANYFELGQLSPWENNRYAFIPRSGLLILLPSVLGLLACISNILPEMQTVFGFFLGFMAFFAWLTFQIVKSLNDKDSFPVEKQIPEYATIGATFFSLFVGGICDEFVDVMLSAYGKKRGLGIIFFCYLVVVHLLFLSLMLDTLCAGYMKQTDETQEETLSLKAKGIMQTFKDLVAATGEEVPESPHGHGHGGDAAAEMRCSREAFLAFIQEVGQSPACKKISDENAKIIFAAMQTDDKMECISFAECIGLLEFKFSTARKYSSMGIQQNEGFWGSSLGRSMIDLVDGSDTETGTLSKFMDRVLICNLFFIIIESYFDLRAGFLDYGPKPDDPWILDAVEYAFGALYLSECVLKISVHGFGRYLSKGTNCFDLFTTCLLLTTQVLEDWVIPAIGKGGKKGGKMQNLNLSTYANLLRLFRLVRLIKQAKNLATVQFMVDCVVRLTMKAREMLILLFVALMVFTMLSVQLWGGKMFYLSEEDADEKCEDPSPAYEAGCLLYKEQDKREEEGEEGLDWLETKEFALNTNDTATAFGFWFVMLLCEFKLSYVDLVWIITGKSKQWFVLCAFWVMSVCITFELVKAFTIEVYINLRNKFDLKEKAKKAKEKEKEKLREKRKAEGIAMEAEGDEDEDDEMQKEGLYKALTFLFKAYDAKKPVAERFFFSDQRPDDSEHNNMIKEIKEMLEGKHAGHGHEEEHHGHGGHEGGHEGHGGHGGEEKGHH